MKHQKGFLFWFLIPALVGQGILAVTALGVVNPPAKQAVMSSTGQVATLKGPVTQ